MQIKHVRFIIAAITTLSAYAVYVSRVNLSIAIIAMVEDGHHNNRDNAIATGTTSQSSPAAPINVQSIQGSSSSSNNNLTFAPNNTDNNNNKEQIHRQPLSTIFPNSKESVKQPLISQKKFNWSTKEQGHILGAFFYGYIVFQIPGARLAESVGAKWILLAANAGSALISLIFPLSTQLNSIHLLMMLRFVMGLCQSAFFPAAYVLFCRWLPEKERAILLPVMFIGSNMGSISTYTMSSYLISHDYGWTSVFYVSGLICTLVTILWMIFGSNEPSDNWFITDDECLFIEGNVNNQSSETNSLDVAISGQMALMGAADATGGGRRRSSLAARSRLGSQSELVDLKKSNNYHHLTSKIIHNYPATLQQETIKLQNHHRTTSERVRTKSMSSNGGGGGKTRPLMDDIESNGGCTRAQEPRAAIYDNQLSWSKLVKSVPVWTLILSMYGNEWSNAVLCYELPTYLNTALAIPIDKNGVLNSFFQLSYTVMSPVISALGAYLLDNHVFDMHKIHVRKLFQSLATFGQLICFVSVPICGPNSSFIIFFMFLAIIFKSCANAGDIMVPGDLSPEYAGTIFAFCNSVGNTAGVFVPYLAAVFVSNQYERTQWTPFWMTTAGIMGFSGLIFLICGETSRQDFTKDTCREPADQQDDQLDCCSAGLNEPAKAREQQQQQAKQ